MPISIGLALVALMVAWSKAFSGGSSIQIDPASSVLIEPSEAGTSGRHAWTIRNQGASPLKLRTHFKSGRCGFSIWLGQDQVLEPGDKLLVWLAWVSPDQRSRSFTNHAEIWTNDPDQPKILLKVRGKTKSNDQRPPRHE